MARRNTATVNSVADLIKSCGGEVRIACDTEFEGVITLTAQFAARLGKDVVVQIYRCPDIPEPPDGFNLKPLHKLVRPWCRRLIFRPVKTLTRSLSPVRVLKDLFLLDDVQPLSRWKADEQYGKGELADPLTVVQVAHFLTADFFRVLGQKFIAGLVRARTEQDAGLCIQSHKLIAFKEVGKYRYSDPVLEYAAEEDEPHPVQVRTFDTSLPFGKGSLDCHAQTFLNAGKVETITQQDKERMLDTFREKPGEAYLYAAFDPVLTLLVEERMREADRNMYLTLGFPEEEVPPLRPTQGSRVAEMILKSITRTSAAGSVLLSQKGKKLKDGALGKPSMAKIKALLSQGARQRIAGEKWSRFGDQTGETHGGLLFSRSPDKFFHAAPGMFRDVDLSSCYGAIIGTLNLYAGRPVIYEPGSKKMTLKQAVAFVRKHAAGNDAWIIKVSGEISSYPNALIPSTKDALTSANYKSQAARKRANQRRYGFVFDWVLTRRTQAGNTAIYTDVVEAGIVAWPTWLMIQALPEEWRKEYERLEVDTVLFHPQKLVADTGEEYDKLVDQYATDGSGWSAKLDMKGMKQVKVEALDGDYATLRFPIGQLARQMTEFRQKAKEEHGKGSAAEQGWKQQVNTMYGVSASRHLVTNSVILANVITATARALAFAMQLSLNGFQVITDGCTCRRDQIPACKLAACLKEAEDYPIRRVEEGVPFVDPATIPQDDAGFTKWYQTHVKQFFGVGGPDYDALFSLHGLEHKKSGKDGLVAFDGLCCDGSNMYVKLLKDGDGWAVLDIKARSYDREAKEVLKGWIVKTYSEDQYDGPPPLVESKCLLSYKDAVREARLAIRAIKARKQGKNTDPAEVLFPLGLDRRKVQAYKPIKLSAFLFRTPEQARKVRMAVQKFEAVCDCGLEVLALRQTRKGRRKGSISDVARLVYDFIRAGKDNLTKELNLNRTFAELEEVRETHFASLEERKAKLRKRLWRMIDASRLDDSARYTGLLVQEGHQILIE